MGTVIVNYNSPNYNFNWNKRIAWLPKRCYVSNKRIWLRTGMEGVRMITGPGEPIFVYKWLDHNPYLIEKLKGTI